MHARIAIAILLVALNCSLGLAQTQIGTGDFKFEVKRRVSVFNLTTSQKKSISIKSDVPGPLVVTDDGTHVYNIGHDGTLTHWNINTAKATSRVLSRIREMHTRVDFMTLANNDRWLVTAGNHHDVGIFDRATGRLLFYMQTGAAAFHVEKVWLRGKRMIVTTDTGVLYDRILQ